MHTNKNFIKTDLLLVAVCCLFFQSCNWGKKKAPQIEIKSDLTQLKVGDYYYSDGTFSSERDSSKMCAGVVFTLETSASEKAHGWTHGQIISLINVLAGENVEWGTVNTELKAPFEKSLKKVEIAANALNGYDCSASPSVSGNSYKAFYIARHFNSLLPSGKTSGWYLPSVGQWMTIISNLSKAQNAKGLFKTDGSFDAMLALENLDILELKASSYWTSSQADKDMAWYVDFGTGSCSYESKDIRNMVRCVAAI